MSAYPVVNASSTSISFATIDTNIGQMARDADENFSRAMEKFSADTSTAGALGLQQASQQWKFAQEAAVKLTENMGDIMKSIIQKS